jgi:xylose dehydrogenase (NAD/NADP)
MSINIVNYGIIGFGSYAKRRLVPAFSRAQYSRLLAISRRQLDAAGLSAQAYNIPYYYSSPEELVKNQEISAVIVATPPVFHYEHSLLVARHGKHLLLEKPMTANANEMEKIITECNRHRVKLMSAFVMRFIDAIQTAKELIQNELLGELSYAGGLLGINASLIKRDWLEDPIISGGGVVADLGSHLLDLLEFITGRRIRQLKPVLQPKYSKKTIDKNAVISLEFESGTIGTLFLSFSSLRESGLTFLGSKGKLSLQNFNRPEAEVELQLTTERGTEKIQVLNRNYYAVMLDHFSRAILFDESILTPGESGWHNQQLIDRIYKRK